MDGVLTQRCGFWFGWFKNHMELRLLLRFSRRCRAPHAALLARDARVWHRSPPALSQHAHISFSAPPVLSSQVMLLPSFCALFSALCGCRARARAFASPRHIHRVKHESGWTWQLTTQHGGRQQPDRAWAAGQWASGTLGWRGRSDGLTFFPFSVPVSFSISSPFLSSSPPPPPSVSSGWFYGGMACLAAVSAWQHISNVLLKLTSNGAALCSIEWQAVAAAAD